MGVENKPECELILGPTHVASEAVSSCRRHFAAVAGHFKVAQAAPDDPGQEEGRAVMSIEWITVLLFTCLFTLLLLGLQVSFALLITGIIFTISLWGPAHLYVLASSMQGALSTEVYIAIPLFILMGNILSHTGIADELFHALYLWTGRLKGGLAMGTVGAGTILAAMCGSSEAGTLTVGLMALPAMLKRGYDARIAIGSIASGGLLGFLIPPSVIAIVYAGISGVSMGKLYFASFIPGILLATLYILYIGIRSKLQPDMCPSIPEEEAPTWEERFLALRKVVLPLLIIFIVLGGDLRGHYHPHGGGGSRDHHRFPCRNIEKKNHLESS